MGIKSNIEKLMKWLNEKPERKKDLLLAGCLTFNLFLTSILIWFLDSMFSMPNPHYGNIIADILYLMIFISCGLGSIFGIFLLMYWEVRLTDYNLIGRWIEKAKEEERRNEEFRKENDKFKNRFKEAYEINVKYFGKLIEINKIDLTILNSRNEFYDYICRNKVSRQDEFSTLLKNKNFVGVNYKTSFIDRILLKKDYSIIMLSPHIFNKESNFNKIFAFNVLVHEISHIFIKSSPKILDFLYNKKKGRDDEECLCYYIGNQKRYFKKEYEHGKKLYEEIKIYNLIKLENVKYLDRLGYLDN